MNELFGGRDSIAGCQKRGIFGGRNSKKKERKTQQKTQECPLGNDFKFKQTHLTSLFLPRFATGTRRRRETETETDTEGRKKKKKESALEDMKLREYDKWKNIDSDDEDRVGSLQQRGAANEDQVMRQLLQLQKEDPGKLKELDAQLEAAKKAAKVFEGRAEEYQ